MDSIIKELKNELEDNKLAKDNKYCKLTNGIKLKSCESDKYALLLMRKVYWNFIKDYEIVMFAKHKGKRQYVTRYNHKDFLFGFTAKLAYYYCKIRFKLSNVDLLAEEL